MPLRPDRVRRGARRVLTSAAPADTEADGDRCRCGRNCSAADVVKPEAVWRIASDWQKADQRHQAARTALRAFARSIDEVALRSRWPPIPLHRPGRDRRSTASTAAPFGRPECGSWADRPLFAGDRALRRSSIAWVRWSGQDPRKTATPPESSGGVAGCPAPTTIAEQLHIQVAPVGSPQGRTAPHGGRNSGTRIGGRPVRVSCDVNERWPSASVGVFLILRFPTLVIVVPCVTTFVLSD